MVQSYKELDVWKKAMRFVSRIYDATLAFPKEELFGLTNQMRRAAVSIPSNIAEGAVRGSKVEFVRFIGISRGSLAELETQIMIAYERRYVKKEAYEELMKLADDISRMLLQLMRSLKR